MRRLTREQVARAAGLFDGEGSVSVVVNGVRCGSLVVRVANGYLAAVKLFERWFGGIVIADRRKPVFIWQSHNKGAAQFLMAVQSHLRIKHKQAALAVQYHVLSPKDQCKRRHLALRIRALNAKRVKKLLSPARRCGGPDHQRPPSLEIGQSAGEGYWHGST